MRTHLFRGLLALALTLAASAPALAQSIVKGTVTDGQGKPVEGATVLMEDAGKGRKAETKTNARPASTPTAPALLWPRGHAVGTPRREVLPPRAQLKS